MRAIINNLINFYQMQAKILNVLLENTQKALRQSEKKKEADEQVQRMENFVRNLILDLNSRLARFYFLREHKSRRQEQVPDSQEKAMTEFAAFVKSLTKSVSSLLHRLQESQTFEEKIDKEIKELEAYVKGRLKEFDKTIEDSLIGRTGTLRRRLFEQSLNVIGSITKAIRRKSPRITKAGKNTKGIYAIGTYGYNCKSGNINSSIVEPQEDFIEELSLRT